MMPHEIKCAVVSRMFRDGIIAGQQYADIDEVAHQAVHPGAKGDAGKEIRDYMIPNDDCPVQEVASDVITLENDRQKIRLFVARYCGDKDEWPAGLKD